MVQANGPDEINVRIFKFCVISLRKSLEIIFKSCIPKCKFPYERRKASVGYAQKKTAENP